MPDGRDQPVLRLGEGVATIDRASLGCLRGRRQSLALPRFPLGAWRKAAPSARARAGCRGPCCWNRPTASCSAAAPLYVKSHSYGEYIFDHGWANAYEKAGGQLLSQASGRRALHAGARARVCWCVQVPMRRDAPPPSGRRPGRGGKAARRLLPACEFPRREG